jgi:excisionase family DNA binding protein
MSNNERAFNIGEFCRRYGIGRTTAYSEVKAGRLALLKVGRRSLITEDDAERWLRNLAAERQHSETNMGKDMGRGHV